MPPSIVQATHEDCAALAAFAAQCFSDTFGHLYRPENLLHHLLHKFSAAYFSDSLASGDTILLMKEGERIIGYGKVGHLDIPATPPIAKGAQEIHRVYIDKSCQGRGLGKQLMLHILSLPRIANATEVYLGVWEENLRAQQLYTQYGFQPVGRYLYQVVDQYDREIIMRRTKTTR